MNLWSTIIEAVTQSYVWRVLAVGAVGLLGVSLSAAAVGRLWRGRPTALAAALALLVAGVVAQLYMLGQHGTAGPFPLLSGLVRRAASWLVLLLDLPSAYADPARHWFVPVVLNLALGTCGVLAASFLAPLLTALAGRGAERRGAGASEGAAVAEVSGWLLDRTSLAQIYATLFLASALAGLILVGWQGADTDERWAQDGAQASARALWIVPCLVFAMLWAATRRPAGDQPPPRAEPEARPRPAEPDLAELFESYRKDFALHLLLARDSPPQAARAAEEGEAHATASRIARVAKREGLAGGDALAATLGGNLDGVWDGVEGAAVGGRGRLALLLGEETNVLHFLVMAELILTAQDRGNTTLVIAPETSADRVCAAIEQALQFFEGGPTHRIFRADRQPGGRYDTVVIPLQRLEAEVLSSREPSIEEARRRFGLLIVVDLHRLDTTLLRLRLIRLARQIEGRPLLTVAQSAPRAGLDPQVRAVLAPLGIATVREIGLTERDAARRFQLVWRNDTAALKALFARELGRSLPDKVLELAPFTLVRAWQRGLAATVFDLAGRIDGTLWRKTVPNLVPLPRARMNPAEVGDLEAGRVSFPTRQHRVVVIEDLDNLVEAMNRSVNFMNNPSVLVHIVAHDYPMRDFLCEVLGQDGGTDSFLPIAPSPRGGPVELALSLADEILRAPGGRVSERALSRCFESADVGERLPRDTWADTSRQGLTELLRAQLGYAPEIQVEMSAGHERQLIFPGAANELRLDPSYLLVLRRDGHLDETPVYLDRNDNGLTYISGSLVQVRGTFVAVGSVDAASVKGAAGQVGGGLAGELCGNRPRYRFARLYEPDLLSNNLALLDERVSADVGRIQPLVLLLRGPVERFTVGFHETAELERPFTAGRGPTWQEETVRTVMPQAMQLLIRLRFGVPIGADPARCAFTLAATLQDVLFSMFPRHGERLAVLSPQASPAVDALLNIEVDLTAPPDTDGGAEQPDPFEIYPAVVMPRLVEDLALVKPEKPARAPVRGGLLRRPVDAGLASARISQMVTAHRQDVEGAEILTDSAVARFGGEGRFFDFLVVEDASHDLGCLRALFQDACRQTVIRVWRRYVRWCAGRTDRPDFYYRYGMSQDRLPAIFDFEAAAGILDLWIVDEDRRR